MELPVETGLWGDHQYAWLTEAVSNVSNDPSSAQGVND
jgi:hypothetical protein